MKTKNNALDQRKRVWRHNAFSGHCAMMTAQLKAMINSDSTSPQTKAIAQGVSSHLPDLLNSLKTRIDPE